MKLGSFVQDTVLRYLVSCLCDSLLIFSKISHFAKFVVSKFGKLGLNPPTVKDNQFIYNPRDQMIDNDVLIHFCNFQ